MDTDKAGGGKALSGPPNNKAILNPRKIKRPRRTGHTLDATGAQEKTNGTIRKMAPG